MTETYDSDNLVKWLDVLDEVPRFKIFPNSFHQIKLPRKLWASEKLFIKERILDWDYPGRLHVNVSYIPPNILQFDSIGDLDFMIRYKYETNNKGDSSYEEVLNNIGSLLYRVLSIYDDEYLEKPIYLTIGRLSEEDTIKFKGFKKNRISLDIKYNNDIIKKVSFNIKYASPISIELYDIQQEFISNGE